MTVLLISANTEKINVDEEMVALMRKAGCQQVSIGFESESERTLKGMNKRFTPRGDACGSGNQADGAFAVGGPGETRESVEESLALPIPSTWRA